MEVCQGIIGGWIGFIGQFFEMYVKQKVMKEREEGARGRYGVTVKNCDSTPTLLRAKELIHCNKENNLNQHNHQQSKQLNKSNEFEVLRSIDMPKRLKTSVDEEEQLHFRAKNKREEEEALRSSQEIFRFKQKQPIERLGYDSVNFGEHMTFGSVSQKRQGMMTSREFLQEKKLKNEVIEEIITNAKRGLCKSFNQFSLGVGGNCVNHSLKKAKYRLISELSEGEQEMFYCSKCAINLLQQGFRIEEIRMDDSETEISQTRLQQITKFELRLKSLEERATTEIDRNENKEQLQMVQQEIFNTNQLYTQIAQILEKQRIERITQLKEMYLKRELQQKVRRENLTEISRNMQDIQNEIKEYKTLKKFSSMKDNQFQFISTSLTNKINVFEDMLQAAHLPSPQQRLALHFANYDSIIEQLQIALADRQETARIRREGAFDRKKDRTEDQFTCDEKKPFRILFPSDDLEQSLISEPSQKRNMLSSVRECPSFGQYP